LVAATDLLRVAAAARGAAGRAAGRALGILALVGAVTLLLPRPRLADGVTRLLAAVAADVRGDFCDAVEPGVCGPGGVAA